MSPRKLQEKLFARQYAHELLNISRDDLKSAEVLAAASGIRLENVFYHAEQCIEKALKAVLCHRGIPVPLVHELSALVAKFPTDMDLPFGYELNELTQFATIRRYEEGLVALTSEEQQAVLKTAEQILAWASLQIGDM